jgi:hypothetical protein
MGGGGGLRKAESTLDIKANLTLSKGKRGVPLSDAV